MGLGDLKCATVFKLVSLGDIVELSGVDCLSWVLL